MGRTHFIRALTCVLALWTLVSQTPVNASSKLLDVIEADFNQPNDIAVANNGKLYVLDAKKHHVTVLDKKGHADFIFGQSGEGRGQLNLPMAIEIEGNQVFIADSGNHRISVFDLNGNHRRHISLPVNSDTGLRPEPVGLVVQHDIVTWSDRRHHRLCQTNIDTGETFRCWGERGHGKEHFEFPFHIATDPDGYLYAVDVLNARVKAFSRHGRVFINLSRFGISANEVFRPNGIAFSEDGRMFVSDSYMGKVLIFRKGRFSGLLSSDGQQVAHFKAPVGLTWNSDRLYVVDARDNTVQIFHSPATDGGVTSEEKTQSNRQSISQKNCNTCHFSWIEAAKPGQMEQDGILPVASQNMCYSCHHGAVIDSRLAIGFGDQHPDAHHRRENQTALEDLVDEIPNEFPLVKDEMTCGTCHTPHTEGIERSETLYEAHANPWFRVLNTDGDLCQKCHESRVDSVTDMKHPLSGRNHPQHIRLQKGDNEEDQRYTQYEHLHQGLPQILIDAGGSVGSNDRLLCQSCHQVHGSEDQDLLLHDFTQDALCLECHEEQSAKDEEEALEKGVHPVNIHLDEPVMMGEKEITEITCSTCHAVHDGVLDSASLVMDNRDGELCKSCHENYEAVVGSDHDLRVTANETENRLGETTDKSGACGACHSMHRASSGLVSLPAIEHFPNENYETTFAGDRFCLDCHNEKGPGKEAPVEFYTHPYRDMVLRSDPEFMPLLDPQGEVSEFGSIACITCHDPHHWSPQENEGQVSTTDEHPENRPGNVFNSFLRLAPDQVAESFCTDCHGMETRLKYKYYHDKRSRDIGADYLE